MSAELLNQIEVELTNSCVCVGCQNCGVYFIDEYFCDECGEELTPGDCVGCFEDSLEYFCEILADWIGSNNPDHVRIEGNAIGWRRLSGSAYPDQVTPNGILEMLQINSDYRLKLIKRSAAEIVIWRYSHDEPTGARFELFAESCSKYTLPDGAECRGCDHV
jgi:hypothetical protein